eukprot:TRINITY_DN33641_c0_g1_i1.p1 TRINITY_DN33641_c0_g1~~TRINITY_DN33641_c0_g1_i1.p1  ORF type:complete len:420 (-),score=81.00 TRINITY_DN33641_c0_g1_i1:21-1280(-)
MTGKYILTAILLCLLSVLTEAKRSEGRLKSDRKFTYLDKFCFSDEGPGEINWSLKVEQPGTLLCYYTDESDSWDKVYHSTLSCEEQIALSVNTSRTGHKCQAIPEIGPEGEPHKGSMRIHDHTRPHYWFLALLNCKNEITVDHYNLHFTNPGGMFKMEISFDYQGLIFVHGIAAILYITMAVFQAKAIRAYIEAGGVHPVIQILTALVGCEIVCNLLYFFHYCIYTQDGIGLPSFNFLGDVFDIITDVILLFLLLILAHGWTISTNTLRNSSAIFGGSAVFAFLYILTFLVDAATRDPASNDWIYVNSAGAFLQVFRMVVGAWFAYALVETRKHENSDVKRDFYRKFGIIYGIWFLSTPVLLVVSTMLDDWVRMKVVITVYIITGLISEGCLVFLFYPTRASEYFKLATPGVSSVYDEI